MDNLKLLPRLPGIYLFKDHEHKVIYIGKAKSLFKRVSSYFYQSQTDWKVKELIKEHNHLSYIVTHSEIEALLLEAQLVRQYQPKYNVLLKAGNPFVYLLITNEELPKFKIVRMKTEKGRYIGPFLHKKEARTAYDYLIKAFQLKLCKQTLVNGCLDYHLGRCAGSCLPSFDPQEYNLRVQLMYEALVSKRYEACLNLLDEQIALNNKNLEFEKSKRLYQYKTDLTPIFTTLKAGYSEQKYIPEVITATIPTNSTQTSYDSISALQELQLLLSLDYTPTTVDCFDISHFQSSYLVGSCVRFTGGHPDKNKYRRFKIKSLSQQNDYAALQEIVTRRYKQPDSFPDIILIDGGKGQLSSVQAVLPTALCISLAKREERLFTPYHPEGIKLDLQSDLGRFLIRARDYAHHAAITYHQVLRAKGATAQASRTTVKLSLP
jgi:excinuclease ABC subunit C